MPNLVDSEIYRNEFKMKMKGSGILLQQFSFTQQGQEKQLLAPAYLKGTILAI